ncbi:MAG: glycosyltransferase family 2 protein [Gemmatimonadales bacterium]
MSPAAPRVSVVIPTRARPASLASCLERLAPGVQTLDAAQYEVVVTDDGETAVTRALLAGSFPWARYSAGPRRGPASNRNAGVRATSGEWVAFTDDDTLPDPDWLEQLLAGSDGVRVVEGRTVCRIGLRSPREHAPINEAGGRWWTSNLAMRRDAFDAIGGFDERFTVPHMEDADLRERALAAQLPWRFVPRAVVDHPPRRERWGADTAPWHRAHMLYAAIHQQPHSLAGNVRAVVRGRLHAIARAPFSVDGASAAASAAVEVGTMFVCWGRWRREVGMIMAEGR